MKHASKKIVSHETLPGTCRTINRDFILGIASVCATFFHTCGARTEQFGMQIKLPASEIKLLEEIKDVLDLKNKIYMIEKGKTAILIVRSQKMLRSKIINFFDDGLVGKKLEQFEKWKIKLNRHIAQQNNYLPPS